jgi:hypothetical protein
MEAPAGYDPLPETRAHGSGSAGATWAAGVAGDGGRAPCSNLPAAVSANYAAGAGAGSAGASHWTVDASSALSSQSVAGARAGPVVRVGAMPAEISARPGAHLTAAAAPAKKWAPVQVQRQPPDPVL